MTTFAQAATHEAKRWMKDAGIYLTRPVAILREYKREFLRPDLFAGLTVAVVMLPQAIAYALIAELPPQTGLYAAVVATLVGALWGSSKHLITGPSNAASLLVLSTLIVMVPPDSPEYLAAAAMMAIMVGIFRLILGFIHMGVLVNFVADSVVIGFTAGAGILIMANQFRHLLGLSIPSSPSLLVTLSDIFAEFQTLHSPSLILGVGTIIVILLVRRWLPKWPNALIGIIFAAAMVALFRLDARGVIVLGEIPRSLPPLSAFSLFKVEYIFQLSAGALAVAGIGLVEALSITRSIAGKTGQRLNSNQEFVGQGLANIAAGLFSGYTTSGSFVRSAINHEAGAKTQLAAVFSSLFVLIMMLALAPLATYLPRAGLAGVIMVTAYYMIDRKEMRRIFHASRGDSGIMVVTMLATLLLPLEFAVLAGVVVSFGRYIVKTSHPRVYPVVPTDNYRHFARVVDHDVCPQLGIIHISGSLFFGATHHVEDVIRENLEQHPHQNVLLLRMHVVDHVDVSGIHMLEAMVRLFRGRHGDVYLSGVRNAVLAQMKTIGFDQYIGDDHFLAREQAVEYLFHNILSPDVCVYECPFRVFAECQALPKFDYDVEFKVPESHAETPVPFWEPSEVMERFNQNDGFGLKLIDVRELSEFEEGHIPHSICIPVRAIPKREAAYPADIPLVLICRTGRRSTLAARILMDLGYENVYNLHGGYLAWRAAGLPVAVEEYES